MSNRLGDTVVFKLPPKNVKDKPRLRAAVVIDINERGDRDLTVFLTDEDTDQGMAPIRRYPGIRMGPGLYQYSTRPE